MAVEIDIRFLIYILEVFTALIFFLTRQEWEDTDFLGGLEQTHKTIILEDPKAS